MTRHEILETVSADTRMKSSKLVEWECRRAAYFAGKMRHGAGRPMGQYFVKRLQPEFEDGYRGVERSDLEVFVVV